MKKKDIIIAIASIVIIGLLIGIFILFGNKPSKDALRFKEEYEALNDEKDENGELAYDQLKISKNNRVIYLTYEELLDFVDNGTGILYFGRPACPWCRKLVPVLLDFAKEQKVDIYYYNIEKDREENNKKYQKIVSIFKKYLPVDTVSQSVEDAGFDENIKRVILPQLFFIKNGEVKADFLAYQHIFLEKKENDKMKELLLDKYNNMNKRQDYLRK